MGLKAGGMTYRRFWLDAKGTDFGDRSAVLERLHTFRFRDPAQAELKKMGWVHPFDILDTEFVDKNQYVGDYLLLSLRLDEKKIPPLLLRALCQKETRALMADKGKERLSKKEKENVRERVIHQLIHGVIPGTKIIEAAINVKKQMFYFYSGSSAALDVFEAYFKKTFDNVALIPYSCANQFLINNNVSDVPAYAKSLENVEAAHFI